MQDVTKLRRAQEKIFEIFRVNETRCRRYRQARRLAVG
ncbi:hypothetical protein MKAN_06435 [Mycobacterium kansasii ATCC 12478]|uniref:Uncharacterized protein n=1 Tax=Mycobacterium kansasii ATCC 12478 TaxID=557599 RepID=U5WXZ1_MYCKA|nr:hypothetical protein MKAN_06435 [Mycobacterium kansasii ATCC 12478]